MTRTPTPRPLAPSRRLHPRTVHLRGHDEQVIGSALITLVLLDPEAGTDPGAWAITHPLGHIAGGTHTEVALVDGTLGMRDTLGDGSWHDPERQRLADDLVRQIANTVYPGTWAFHYHPAQVPGAVLRHGSLVRERIEVTAVELWNEDQA